MKKDKGFTLIELMIVIAIIGILVAIVAPLFENKQPGIEHAEDGTIIINTQEAE